MRATETTGPWAKERMDAQDSVSAEVEKASIQQVPSMCSFQEKIVAQLKHAWTGYFLNWTLHLCGRRGGYEHNGPLSVLQGLELREFRSRVLELLQRTEHQHSHVRWVFCQSYLQWF